MHDRKGFIPLPVVAMLLLISLPLAILKPFIGLAIPAIATAIYTPLHAWLVKGEGWYGQQNTAVHVAIAGAVGLFAMIGAAALGTLPGGAAVASACAASLTLISADCEAALNAFLTPGLIQAGLAALLPILGVGAVKLHAIHQTQKAIAQKAGIVLPPSAR